MFYNQLNTIGGVHIVTSAEEAKEISSKMLGQTLITKQTGPQGKPVNKVLLQERLYARRELYLAILLDRATKSPVLVASKKGGMNIEDVAAESPEHIIKMPINVEKGLVDEDLEKVAQQMGFKNETGFAIQQIKRLYEMFQKTDALLVEINPLMETPGRRLICSDAKVNFDDNAEFRQPEIFKLRDLSQIDPREVHAQKYNLSYIGLDGNIGCIVNGAGLAMATMDIIKVHGGNPANFLDVGGGATQEQIQEALRILNQDPQVKAILVNIFGGIMRCDVMANAIINAMTKNEKFSVPLVVRLQGILFKIFDKYNLGTNSVKAKEILKESGLRIIPADDLDEAARKAVGVANIVQVAESVDIDVEFRS